MKRFVRLLAVVAYNGIARQVHAMVPGGHQVRRQLARLMCARVSPTASIEPGVRLSRHLYLGDRTGVGADTWFIGAGDIVLGHRLRMGPQCLFITNDHRIPGDFQTFDDSGGTSKSIIVGDDVFIGARTTVLGGVEIGHGVAIGAGSVVTRSIPAGSVAAGNPAAVIRSRAV